MGSERLIRPPRIGLPIRVDPVAGFGSTRLGSFTVQTIGSVASVHNFDL